MSEQIRSIKVAVEVDTNKRTVSRSWDDFEDFDEAVEWLREFFGVFA